MNEMSKIIMEILMKHGKTIGKAVLKEVVNITVDIIKEKVK